MRIQSGLDISEFNPVWIYRIQIKYIYAFRDISDQNSTRYGYGRIQIRYNPAFNQKQI